jgi:hypothetical protein
MPAYCDAIPDTHLRFADDESIVKGTIISDFYKSISPEIEQHAVNKRPVSDEDRWIALAPESLENKTRCKIVTCNSAVFADSHVRWQNYGIFLLAMISQGSSFRPQALLLSKNRPT